MRISLPFLFLLLCNLWFCGCVDEDFTTNPAHRLSYSADTVRFDTLFTTISSSTTQLMVYNRNKKAINIESIQLVNSATSGFRINVDGMRGDYFEQIEVSGRDSLYIFIEATINPTGENSPQRHEDVLRFNYNGIWQEVTLEAYGQDAILWRGKVIDCDTTLTATKPFLIYDSLVIAPNRTLTLEAGTRLFMHDKARILAEGTIRANGNPENPVVLRGDRTDKLFSNLAYDQMAGQWAGIVLGQNSFGNEWRYTHIRGTSFGIRIDSTTTNRQKLLLEGCILKNSKQSLISAVQASVNLKNCELSNAGGALLHLQGGEYVVNHCTMVNYYPFGVINEAVVYLSNYRMDEQGNRVMLPLTRADFNNTLIWGKRSVEVNLDEYQSASAENTLFAHRFDHCLIKAKGEDDENFIATVWNKDPLFRDVKEEEYRFDFSLTPESPAYGAGNLIWSQQVKCDITGTLRNETRADIGAWEIRE